ncbi:MAG: leucyl aminopeptidase [Rhodospirillales bacterium]|nr:leucyl aminopeptidase [Rhodospirillales bacterium]
MKITFAKHALPPKGILVVFAGPGPKLLSSAETLDEKTDGALSRAMKVGKFKGKYGQMVSLYAPQGSGLDRIFIVGTGKAEDLTDLKIEDLGGKIYGSAMKAGTSVSILHDHIVDGPLSDDACGAHMAFGLKLRSYRFDKYRTKEKAEAKPSLKNVRILCQGYTAARKQFETLDKVAEGVFLTRNLVSEPANVIYPKTLAKQAKELEALGLKVSILGEKQMKKLGMGALLGVGQGSSRDSQMVIMEWNGLPKGTKETKGPIAFVGKGVTFDSGGISIKPAGGMEDMKWDMGGSGVVIGLMKALAGRKAKTHAVGVVGLVENMPSGNAQRPGDVVTSMSGQTIEVINTDAEGRLVLADALWYTQETYKPQFMVDLATLTGAIMVALGQEMAGLFSNNDQLSKRLTDAGKAVGEEVWRLPMGDNYDALIKSQIADMKNVGGRFGGSITAAQFLERFVNKTPWAHLDIAGVTWSSKVKPTVPRGGTGYGVRLLDRLVADHYEV